MFGLEKFIETFKNPKVIIPTLLAIIIVGSISGGIWINNLKDTISQHKELEDSKIGLIDERSKAQSYRMATRLNDFGYEFEKTKKVLRQTGDSISSSLSNIENLVSLNKDEQIKEPLNEELRSLKRRYLSYTSTIRNLDSQYKFSQDAFTQVTLNKSEKPDHGKKQNILLYVILSLTILILSLLLILNAIKNKNKSKPSK